MEPKDLSALVQLALGAADREDHPPAAAAWAVERLCKLTGASAGVMALARRDGEIKPLHNGAPRWPDTVENCAARSLKQARPAIVHPSIHITGSGMCSVYPLADATASVIWLQSPRNARREWTCREITILELAHPELIRLHTPPPSTNGLPPRQQQTLRLLLRGLSEKQIASELELSVHTVHVYVKSIYRAHKVSSRAELLARWVKT